MNRFRYPAAGLGTLLLIPWLGLVAALGLGYMVVVTPHFLVPSTVPAGYFGLLLAGATSFYFFRYDWHRRHQFEAADEGLTVIRPRGAQELFGWGGFTHADFRTNSGALILTHGTKGRLVLYPASLGQGAELVATIDARTSLRLATIVDLQAALERGA